MHYRHNKLQQQVQTVCAIDITNYGNKYRRENYYYYYYYRQNVLPTGKI